MNVSFGNAVVRYFLDEIDLGTHCLHHCSCTRKNRYCPSVHSWQHSLEHTFSATPLCSVANQILGMCFFFGGLRRKEGLYNSLVSQTSASMMTVSVASLLIPAAFHATFPGEDLDEQNTLKISRASSIVLLLVYFTYLILLTILT